MSLRLQKTYQGIWKSYPIGCYLSVAMSVTDASVETHETEFHISGVFFFSLHFLKEVFEKFFFHEYAGHHALNKFADIFRVHPRDNTILLI